MKFTLSWLREHLDTDAPIERIAATLSAIGLEVESIENRGDALASFRIARVIEAIQHPNADRLRVCRVDTGDGEVTVVCGAPNARTGMRGVFASPGSFIPGTGITLKAGEIRGVKSAGMLLSAREMGLGDDHTGIVDLPEDAPVGESYASWAGLDDPLIDISVTPNRGDALSVRGVARDLAAAGIGTLRPWSAPRVPTAFEGGPRWRVEWREACAWVLGRTIRGLRNGPSPVWLRDRLTAIGLRPINTLADITNFFTIDLGRPLHVFDVNKLRGDVLTMRRGRNETFLGLHDKEVTATEEDCVIADAGGAISLAGVVGGEGTGCDESTTATFIECALFDPVRVAQTGRRHQIASDARQRFERGIDPAFLPDGLEAATRVILDICGGEPGPVVSDGAEPAWQRDATLRFRRLREFGGAEVAPDEVVERLQRLGFTLRGRASEHVVVAVPSWRNDIAAPMVLDQAPGLDSARAAEAAEGCAEIEPEADLIEEVLRLRGLEEVPPVSLPRAEPVPPPTLTPAQVRRAIARRAMAARGLAECITFSFVAREEAALFGEAPESLRLLNPIAADLDQLRPTPLGSLASAARRNAAYGFPDLGLFEIGPGFAPDAPEGQRLIAAGLRMGATPRHWAQPGRPVDPMDAKGDLSAVLTAVGFPLEALTVTPDAPGCYHPGRSGVVRQGPKLTLGMFGELHPRVLAVLDLPGPIVGFELDLDAIAEPKRRRGTFELSPFQPVRRDFAFVLDAGVPADAVVRAARGAVRDLIAGVTVFDRYEGGALPAGTVSLGIGVTFRPKERTLTEAELAAASEKVVAAVVKTTGGVLR